MAHLTCTLTTPADVEAAKPASASALVITEYSLDRVGKIAQAILCRDDGGVLSRIPGVFIVRDVAAGEGGSASIGGAVWTVAEGAHYTTHLAGAAAGETAMWAALQAMYSELAGSVA